LDNDLDPAKTQVALDHRAPSYVLTGIVLIILGALFFIDRLGWDMGWGWHPTLARMWPILLIAAGLSQLLSPGRAVLVTDRLGRKGRTYRSRSSAGFWALVVGVIMLLDQNGWLTLDRSWPLFVVAGGLSMLLRPRDQIRGGQ
jgi:hypothetical protein